MLNLSFELGWEDVVIGASQGQPGRMAQRPYGWLISARPVGSLLLSAGVFPGDHPPVLETVKTIPEVRHIRKDQLPPEERPGGPKALILDGEWTFKVFSAYSPYSFTMETYLASEDTGAEPGDIVQLTVPVCVHYHPYPGGDGSLGACRWRVIANGAGGTWHTYQFNIEDRRWHREQIEAKTDAQGGVALRIDLESASEAGITYFVDGITYKIVPAEPPEPEPGECRGSPRLQYVRTFVLLPPQNKLTPSEFGRLLSRLAPDMLKNGWTVGFSADDAGIGDLDVRRVIAVLVHDDDWDRGALQEFFLEYYPGVELEFRFMGTEPHFPMETHKYPPAAWYVSQGFSLGPTGHPGIDINLDIPPWGDVERGEPVTAIYSGVVHYVTDDWGGVGMMVVKHTINGHDYWCRYAHLDVGGLSPGDYVDSGQTLGRIADWRGGDGGDHLHFEVHTDGPVERQYRVGDEIDPVQWMKDELGLDPVLVDAFVRKGDTPPDPEPQLPDPEPVYSLRSSNVIGLHSGFPAHHWDTYWVEGQPTAQKVFSLGFGMEARRLVPDPNAIIDWRKFADDLSAADNPVQLLDRYSAEIMAYCKAEGASEADVLEAITTIESLNETIGTFCPDAIKRAVDFDVGFARAVHQRYGDAIRVTLLNVAVGNPHETEVELLLPAARAAYHYGGFIGYHAYWTANEERDWLLDHWNIHAGRWMRWDDVFRAYGIYPRYLLSEGGIVYAADGVNFDSGRGWRSCGPFNKYLDQMTTFRRLVRDWNQKHGNRAAALTVFCHGNNWPNFEIGEGNVLLMRDRAVAEWIG